MAEILGELGAEIRTVERELDVGAEEVELLADVVATLAEHPAEHRLDVEEQRDGVGELQLPADAGRDPVERVEDARA